MKNSDIPDLAITRIFGDLIVHSVGVIVEPEIGIYYFGGCETFIIVASDGVWDLNDSEESVHYVKKFYENGLDACGVVNVLVKEAYRRWRRDNEKKEYEKFEEYLIKENNKNEFEENEKHNFEFNEEDEEKESEMKVQINNIKANNIKNISIYSNIDDLLDCINEGENVKKTKRKKKKNKKQKN